MPSLPHNLSVFFQPLARRAPARIGAFACLFAALGAAPSAGAAGLDAMEAEFGRGQHVNVYGVGVGGSTDWKGSTGSIEWGLKWQARLQHWQADSEVGGKKSLNLVGFTPILRATHGPERQARFFLDLGIGINLLSAHQIGNRELSTNLQFGEIIGAGFAFGPEHRYELGVRAQHVSNAGIKKPNAGLSYLSVDLRYRF